jgi:hypothetical protein
MAPVVAHRFTRALSHSVYPVVDGNYLHSYLLSSGGAIASQKKFPVERCPRGEWAAQSAREDYYL